MEQATEVPSIWDPKSSVAELTTSTGTSTHSECSSNGTVEILAVVTALMTCLVVVLIVVIVILRKRLRKMGNSNRARGIGHLNATGGHQDGAVLMKTDPVFIAAVMTQVDPSQCLARVK
ncbi:uncharacterized protein [Littorina saxatilis]|uniref:uncharacterized protein n=1 Tax=Littorina saxatilis TaxID=31220 RepID=UPI0038B5981E